MPAGLTRGSRIRPKIVSLVPSEIATMPSRTRPVPTRLQGLSPDHATTAHAGRRWRCCQYVESAPTIVDDGTIAGSFAARSGAVASTAGVHHRFVARSIRFMPDPSPGSTGACAPTSSDARYELTRWIRSVAPYARGSVL